ncbi:hypothetical protein [Microbacterium invictum]|uniref:Secreted protein n=1 Tax=Microbacterium invictum TaxID=515415 RepID=A0ABZ0VE87_9MICO|nr:hypothetical protein [Microbacterium invictum]WQB70440.1 hypothetical protein T9R20_00335 [Microbacterium invictum]
MDPITAIAEFWWIGASAAGAGTIGWFGLRFQRAKGSRRLGLQAARHELREARDVVTASRVEVRVARAELARAQADRAADRVPASEVSLARQRLQQAQREVRAAHAEIRLRRIQVSAARATIPRAKSTPDALPLGRLMAAHTAIDTRWLEYETDPAKRIAFPAMSDVRQPSTAAYLAARAEAGRLRPPTATTRMTPAEFAQYRAAVENLGKLFERAEREAWRAAGAGSGPSRQDDPHWVDLAQSVAQTVIARGTEAIARVAESNARNRERGSGRSDAAGGAEGAASPSPDPAGAEPHETRAPQQPRTPVWPVPSRGARREAE